MTAETQKQTINLIAPWFGAKRVLASRIVEAIGRHRCYWSIFCGSLAVELEKEPATMETVNDLHGDLINLARVLRDEDLSGRLYWKLRRTLFAEPLFRESLAALGAGECPDEPNVLRAYHYFVVCWMGMGGIAGTQRVGSSFCRRFSSKGGSPGTRFLGAAESIPWWHERLRAVMVLRQCGIELAEKIEDADGTVIFSDAPYFEKGSRYLHDFTQEDHERLAMALNRFQRTHVVVTYYEHPEIDRLYPGWHRINCGVPKNMINAAKRAPGKTEAPEVILVNRPEVPA